MPELPGLAMAADRLHQTLRDPQLGDCVPGLPDGGALLLGLNEGELTKDDVDQALKQAREYANGEKASLILALLGHGLARENGSMYFMAWDSTEEKAEENAVNVSDQIGRFLGPYRSIDGVVVLVDTCGAAGAIPDKDKLIGGLREGRTRLSMLMASAVKEWTSDMRFTNEVDTLLRAGLPGAGTYLDMPTVKRELTRRLKDQTITVLSFDGCRFNPDADLGIWLAHNRQSLDSWSGTLDVEWVQQLTADFYPTAAFRRLCRAITCNSRWTEIRAPAGGGKSTLMAALTLGRILGISVARAMVFCDHRDSLPSITATITRQLAVRIPASMRSTFCAARDDAREVAVERGLSAWQTDVVIPLAALGEIDAVIGIDGVDQLSRTAQQALYHSINILLNELGDGVRIVTSRRDSHHD